MTCWTLLAELCLLNRACWIVLAEPCFLNRAWWTLLRINNIQAPGSHIALTASNTELWFCLLQWQARLSVPHRQATPCAVRPFCICNATFDLVSETRNKRIWNYLMCSYTESCSVIRRTADRSTNCHIVSYKTNHHAYWLRFLQALELVAER